MDKTDKKAAPGAGIRKFGELIRAKEAKAVRLMELVDSGIDIICYNYCSLTTPLDDADPESFLGEMQVTAEQLLQEATKDDAVNISRDEANGVVASIIRDMAVRRVAADVDKKLSEFALIRKLYTEMANRIKQDDKKTE